MWGARGPFLPAAAMFVVVVTPVVFCAKATEICNENTIFLFISNIFIYITIHCKTYCNSLNANCRVAQAQVVPWPDPQWTPA